tara:strand:- start:22923 stop:25427 length:2505 start_codon:yes stop_codon:yes gene_type:complete
MIPRPIRSAAQRQILIWLRHGPSTVSEIAQQFSMRMPHASLACRQLREAGLITRDERGGLRNAPIFLSQLGHERLREDAVGKMMHYADVLHEFQGNLVLHADDANVLLAYTQMPKSSFVFVEDAIETERGSSSGNRGGAWILAPASSVQWYDLQSGAPVDPPAPRETRTLAAFESSQQRIGLVRGEVFEQRGSHALVEGQTFSASNRSGASPPLRLQHGLYEVGSIDGADFAYSPPRALRAHLQSTLNRSLLLNSMSTGALEISDRKGIKQRELPVGVLNHWLRIKHPRMGMERLNELYNGLIASLEQGPQSTGSALEREVRMEFGETAWVERHWDPGYVDIYGASQRAVVSILNHVIAESNIPFVVDWVFDGPGVETEGRLLGHPLCRGLLSRRGAAPAFGEEAVLLTDAEEMGRVDVRLGRSTVFTVELFAPGVHHRPSRRPFTRVPADVGELLNHRPLEFDGFSAPSPSGEAGQRWQDALQLYPEGDEQQANAWEAIDPLAAWIASPQANRPSRWIRLQSRLPHGWVELLGVHDVPLNDLPIAMLSAGPTWQRDALRRIQTVGMNNAGSVLHWRHQLQHQHPAEAAFATCLLCSLDSTNPEHRGAFQEATRVWFNRPMCEIEVLEAMFSRQQGAPADGLLEEWKAQALLQPPESLLHAWATGLNIALQRMPWVSETQRNMMERLPASWWSVFSSSWLLNQLGSHTGRSWLAHFSCCWPAQVARTPGEPSRYPGLVANHQACDLTSESLLAVRILNDGPGTPPLVALYEMIYALEQSLPVSPLSLHPQAGWLVRPVEQWPPFGSEVLTNGDPAIGEILFTRSFHVRLLDAIR